MGNLGWALTAPLWPFFGFLTDRPRNVRANEPVLSQVAAWISVAFYYVASAYVVSLYPLLCPLAAVFVGSILARRVGASGTTQHVMHVRDVAQAFKTGLVFALLNIALSLGFYALLPGGLDGAAQVATAIYVAFTMSAWFGVNSMKRAAAERARALDDQTSRFTAIFAAIFDVDEHVIENQAVISRSDSGVVTLQPVPPAITANLVSMGRDAVDRRAGAVAPRKVLSVAPDFASIVLTPC